MIDQEFLAILVCPKCKGTLDYRPSEDQKNGVLICKECRLQYQVTDDIPNLIIEEASEYQEN